MHVVPFAGKNHELPLLLCDSHLKRPELIKQVLLAILAIQAFNLLYTANHELSSLEHGVHLCRAMYGAAFTGAAHSTCYAATHWQLSSSLSTLDIQ